MLSIEYLAIMIPPEVLTIIREARSFPTITTVLLHRPAEYSRTLQEQRMPRDLAQDGLPGELRFHMTGSPT